MPTDPPTVTQAPPARLALTRNRLLAVMTEDALARLSPHLQAIELSAGKVLYESGVELTHLYFPTSAIVALVCLTTNGASTEIALVGNEGVVGVALFMGGGSTTSRAVVQSAGQAFRIKAAALKTEFDLNGAVMRLLLRYAQSLITQMAQTAVCNRHHLLEQRLSRWLLMNLDRQPGLEVAVTHEALADLLGVRREGVTEAASALRQLGLITSSRGHITVLDRSGIEANACECYAVVKRETDRLLPNRPAT